MVEKNWKSIIVSEEIRLIDAIKVLNNTGLLMLIVTNKSLKLKATITDGDIRKGLAKGITLEDKIHLVMKLNPKYVTLKTNYNEIKNLFGIKKYKAIPVVDESKKVVNCHFQNDFFENDINPPLLIMAGGFGKRLGKLTRNSPKPMIKVQDRPILEHIIDKAKNENLTNIFISTHFKSHIIEDYFGDGTKFDVKITYIKEKKPLGTGGSFKFMNKFKGPVIITNGDIISKIGYRKLLDFHELNNSLATMAVIKNEIINPYGVVKFNGINMLDFEEKPLWTTYINAGIYIIDAKVTKFIKRNENISMPLILKRLKNKNQDVYIFHMHEDWIDVGTPEELNKIRLLDE